tara:strand:+ start:955 stop:1578 length:624 start_codon:yes stop_codon:yes gene_type:complete
VKKFKNLQIIELNKIKKKDLQQIQKLIKSENPSSIIASFDYDLIQEYLKKIASSKDSLLYVMKLKDIIISYIIIIKKFKKLNFIFSDIKMKLIISLFLNLKLFTLLNLFLSFYELDIIFLSKTNKLILKDNFNLNLFAVEKNYQSKGFGTFFLKKIFNKIKNKTKYMTVETIDFKATKFYNHKHKFKLIGSRIRFPNNQQVMIKRIT